MALAGTTNQVERIVSAYRRAEPIAVEREQAQHDLRSLHHHIDDDGSVVITVRLPSEAGTTVLSAIEHLVAPSVAQPDGSRDPLSARRADALVDLAIAGHAASASESAAPRYLVRMHVTQSALRGGDGCCEIDGHGDSLDQPIGISVETALRLSCDADIETVVTDDEGNVKHLSARQRLVRGALRRQVEARDDHRCQVPGCGRRARLEVHHLRHRAHGGQSKLPNLTLLCRFHHHRLHEGGWTSVRTPDGLEFHDPHGRCIRARPPTTAGDQQAVEAHSRTAADGRCRWTGERLDLDMALTALFSLTHTPQGVRRRSPDRLGVIGPAAPARVTHTVDGRDGGVPMSVVMLPPAPNMASSSSAPWSAKEAKAVARAADARIKELRPWYLKKRYIFTIAVLLIVGFAIANSQGSKDEPTVSGVDKAIGAADASADVSGAVLGQPDAIGFRRSPLTVTNNSSKRSNYMIDLSIESPDGATQYDTSFASVNNLEPGQTTTAEAFSITKTIPADAVVKIKTVSRLASN